MEQINQRLVNHRIKNVKELSSSRWSKADVEKVERMTYKLTSPLPPTEETREKPSEETREKFWS